LKVDAHPSPAINRSPRFQRPGELAVVPEELASTMVVQADGDIDYASVHQLTGALDRVDLRTITLLVLDLVEVRFLDLAGLNAILRLNEECKSFGVHLSVIAPSGPAKRLFTLTRVDRELDLVEAVAGSAR
jgi:anti-anti-sigma factor